ncbi:hypothetical protein F4X88_11720 [Candidatus Poribacteria bacterium]|nr:hypothetical protein [Candidatus Poribacteria bacterium]
MKLSENQELVQKLKQILEGYPGAEYDEHSSARMDNILMVKISADVRCSISDAANIARKLSESTGDSYIPQLSASSGESTLDNLRSFNLFLPEPNKNVRITYPDSKDGILEVDVVQGVEMSLKVDDSLWCFAEGNKLEIRFNIFAHPNYRKFLRSHVTTFTRNYNVSAYSNHFSSFEFKQTIDDGTDLSKNSLD